MNKQNPKSKNASPLSEEKLEKSLHKKSRSLDNHPRPSPYAHVPSFQVNRDQSQHFGTYSRPQSTRSISVPIQDDFHTVSTEHGTTRSVHVPHQPTSDFPYGLHDVGPYRSASVPPQHNTGHSQWGLDPYGSQSALFLGGKEGAVTQGPPTSQFSSLSLDPPTFQGSLHKPSLREPLIMGGMSPPSLGGGGVGRLGMEHQARVGPAQDEFSRLMERNPILHAPAPPRFLQPKCTLTTSGELNDTLIRTTQFFVDNKIDFRFMQEMPGTNERCCMFECKTYDLCSELRLHVYFYSQEKAGTYLVEFMRRMGDSVHFSGVMRKARIFFGQSGSPLPTPPTNIPALNTPQHDDSTRQAVMTLKGMVESRYLDVKYEGIRGLANMSKKDENVTIMAESGCVDLFVENLESDVTNVHRCAVTGVANLAHKPTEDSAKLYQQRCVPAILKLIANSNTLEVIRESARALEIICRKLGAQYFRSRDFFDGVSKLMQTPDAVVYGYGTRLSKVLERSASVS